MYLILLFISLLCFAGSFKIFFSNILFLKNAVTVQGTIVRYDSHIKKDRETQQEETWYTAVIAFPFDGKTREITSSISSTVANDGNIGQIRKVAISPNNNARLVRDVIMYMLLWPALLLILGTVCLLIGLFLSPYLPKLLAFMKSENGRNATINFIRSYSYLFVGVTKSIKLIFVSLPLLLALTPGVFGAWLLYSRGTFFKNAIIVQGAVVDFTKHYDREKDMTMYTPIISYFFNGQKRHIKSNISSNTRPDIGEQYQVAINPKNNYEARIYSKWDYAIAIGLMCFSGILLIFILRRFISF